MFIRWSNGVTLPFRRESEFIKVLSLTASFDRLKPILMLWTAKEPLTYKLLMVFAEKVNSSFSLADGSVIALNSIIHPSLIASFKYFIRLSFISGKFSCLDKSQTNA